MSVNLHSPVSSVTEDMSSVVVIVDELLLHVILYTVHVKRKKVDLLTILYRVCGGVQFVYAVTMHTKAGFPMLKQSKKIRNILDTQSFENLKQLDIASIASNILEVPIPFSSLGVFHPVFHMSENMLDLPQRMLANLFQLNNFIDEYCGGGGPGEKMLFDWCEDIILDFEQKLIDFSDRASKVIETSKNSLPS